MATNLWKNFNFSGTSLNLISIKHVVAFCSSLNIQDQPWHPPGPPHIRKTNIGISPQLVTIGKFGISDTVCQVIFLILTSSWGLVAAPVQCALPRADRAGL